MNIMEILFAISRKANKAEIMTGFVCFEHLQGAFRCGIMLSDGTQADGIGRVKDAATFLTRAEHGKTDIVWNPEHHAAKLEILVRDAGPWAEVSYYIFRSWTGKRKINGKPYNGPVKTLGAA